jgi:hypothetical protein
MDSSKNEDVVGSPPAKNRPYITDSSLTMECSRCTKNVCTKQDKLELFRHMFKHWPWQMSHFVCTYCEEGYADVYMMEAHMSAELHTKKRREELANNVQQCDVNLFRDNWMTKARETGQLSHYHQHRLANTMAGRMTTDELEQRKQNMKKSKRKSTMDLPSPKRKCTEINAVEVAVSNTQTVYEQEQLEEKPTLASLFEDLVETVYQRVLMRTRKRMSDDTDSPSLTKKKKSKKCTDTT